MTLLQKAYNCTEKVLKAVRFPSVERKIEREIGRAIDKADDSLQDFETNLLLQIKKEVEEYKTTDDVDINSLLKLVRDKEKAEKDIKQLQYLKSKILDEKSMDADEPVVLDNK